MSSETCSKCKYHLNKPSRCIKLEQFVPRKKQACTEYRAKGGKN